MTASLTFAPAGEADIEPLFAFNRELILTYEDLSSIDVDRVLAWVQRKLRVSIDEYQRAVLDGQTVGYFHFCRSGDEMELDDLYVLAPFRGRGIGTAILQKCLSEAKRPIFLYVFTRNAGARRLYRRMGFEEAETVGQTRLILRWQPR